MGIRGHGDRFVVMFIGTIGHQFDLDTVRSGRPEILGKSERSITFVFCGSGDRLESYKKLASDNDRILFPAGSTLRRCTFCYAALPSD